MEDSNLRCFPAWLTPFSTLPFGRSAGGALEAFTGVSGFEQDNIMSLFQMVRIPVGNHFGHCVYSQFGLDVFPVSVDRAW